MPWSPYSIELTAVRGMNVISSSRRPNTPDARVATRSNLVGEAQDRVTQG